MTSEEAIPQEGQTIAVWFSCGAASAVAAKLTIELYGKLCRVRVLNNPVVEEDEDNRRFLIDVQAWLNTEIEIVKATKYPTCSAKEVWATRKYMGGVSGAPCTIELKKIARQEWERNNQTDWHVLGFTADEIKRHNRFVLGERSNLLPILINANKTKRDCFRLLKAAGIELPRIYKLGYPNANCVGCVKASSPTYWNLVRNQHPDVFADRAKQSRELGARLVRVRGERIFLDELAPYAVSRVIPSMHIECGVFCEEKS